MVLTESGMTTLDMVEQPLNAYALILTKTLKPAKKIGSIFTRRKVWMKY